MILCGHTITPTSRLFAIAGPCVIESEALTLSVAETLGQIARRLGITLIFKSSFDKANRSSDKSFRGLAWMKACASSKRSAPKRACPC
jgi:2-dehydro-3-deoxyphosphooctonate aldolase (KDO 8-P synthase)